MKELCEKDFIVRLEQIRKEIIEIEESFNQCVCDSEHGYVCIRHKKIKKFNDVFAKYGLVEDKIMNGGKND